MAILDTRPRLEPQLHSSPRRLVETLWGSVKATTNPWDFPQSLRLRADFSEPSYFSTALGGRDQSSALCNTEGQDSHNLGKRPQGPYVGIQL